MKKICTQCHKEKVLEEFNKWKRAKDGHMSECRSCQSKRKHKWYLQNAERQKKYHYGRVRMIKYTVLSHYCKGEPHCQCPGGCPERYVEFLEIDHIKGKGKQHFINIRKHGGIDFYRWLIKNNYPQEYRVLCSNCNKSLGNYGYCPHQKGSYW